MNKKLSYYSVLYNIMCIAELQARQSSSLDWRVGHRVNQEWRGASRSAEQLSRSPNLTSGGLHTPSAKYVTTEI